MTLKVVCINELLEYRPELGGLEMCHICEHEIVCWKIMRTPNLSIWKEGAKVKILKLSDETFNFNAKLL